MPLQLPHLLFPHVRLVRSATKIRYSPRGHSPYGPSCKCPSLGRGERFFPPQPRLSVRVPLANETGTFRPVCDSVSTHQDIDTLAPRGGYREGRENA